MMVFAFGRPKNPATSEALEKERPRRPLTASEQQRISFLRDLAKFERKLADSWERSEGNTRRSERALRRAEEWEREAAMIEEGDSPDR